MNSRASQFWKVQEYIMFVPSCHVLVLVCYRASMLTGGTAHALLLHYNTRVETKTMAGVAGRTNYAKWEKVASDLEKNVVVEEREEIAESAQKLGLDGKYPHSQAEAEERTKARQVKQTKQTLDKYKKREESVLQTFSGLLGRPVEKKQTNNDQQEADDSHYTRNGGCGKASFNHF